MKIEIIQCTKELFSAEFNIYSENKPIGKIKVKGCLTTPESKVNIVIYENIFNLEREFKSQTKRKGAYRPYRISRLEEPCGEVFQAEEKISLFKSFGYQYAQIENKEYKMYPIGFGEDGAKNPVYHGDTQIALVKKKAIVENDMHNFEVICIDENSALIATIFCAYIYAKSFFKTGDKLYNSKVIGITVTSEKKVIDKYNEDFEKRYGV